MINVTTHTKQDITNRPRNFSSILSDDEWYAMCNELGELNERQNDGWTLREIFEKVKLVSLSSDYEYAVLNDFQEVFDSIEKSNR